MIVMALVGAASVVLAVHDAAGHRWASMVGSLLVAVAMACNLYAQRRLGKQRAGRSHPS